MTFAEKIKSERGRLGLTQTAVERLLGLGSGVITSWETERWTPRAMVQQVVLTRLGKMKTPKLK